MRHDLFVGQVQHRALLPSRGDAERAIRATLETLSERLQPTSASHLAAQLPIEIARHLVRAEWFEHLTLEEFLARVAERERVDAQTALLHVRAVMQTVRDAISAGALEKLEHQLPEDYRELLGRPVVQLC